MALHAPRISRILLDYGHGGWLDEAYPTPGKQYHFEPDGPSIYEGIINRKVAVPLINLLQGARIEVFDMVADKTLTEPVASWEELEQSDPGLQDRLNAARRASGIPHPSRNGGTVKVSEDSLLFSIHTNAIGNEIRGPSQSARGISFFTNGDTDSGRISDSMFAACQNGVTGTRTRRPNASDGHLTHNASFMLTRAYQPSILVEGGFFTNLEDAEWLMTDEGARELATAYFVGLRPYLYANP